jgi:carbonic anhydrase
VVLGHDACAAVAATLVAVQDGTTARGYLWDVIVPVTPSVLAAQAAGVSEDDGFITTHVRHTFDLLMDRSQELADRVAFMRNAVVGLTYGLADSSVRTVASRGLDLPPDGTAAPAVASTSTIR